jgi:hypothetical protein
MIDLLQEKKKSGGVNALTFLSVQVVCSSLMRRHIAESKQGKPGKLESKQTGKHYPTEKGGRHGLDSILN